MIYEGADMRLAVTRALCDRAATDPMLMLITGDAGFGALDEFRDTYPKQFLNAGIAEQNMTGMGAGMAIMGHKVVLYNIINFLLYRPFEQVRNDICGQGLPVVLMSCRPMNRLTLRTLRKPILTRAALRSRVS